MTFLLKLTFGQPLTFWSTCWPKSTNPTLTILTLTYFPMLMWSIHEPSMFWFLWHSHNAFKCKLHIHVWTYKKQQCHAYNSLTKNSMHLTKASSITTYHQSCNKCKQNQMQLCQANQRHTCCKFKPATWSIQKP